MDTTVIVALVGFGGVAVGKLVDLLIDRLKRHDGKVDAATARHSDMMDAITGINKKIDCIRHKVGEMDDKAEEREAKAARNRILRFGDELYQNIRHSKDLFDMILLDIDFYESYCSEHKDFANSITVMTVEHIRETYRECSETHSFL